MSNLYDHLVNIVRTEESARAAAAQRQREQEKAQARATLLAAIDELLADLPHTPIGNPVWIDDHWVLVIDSFEFTQLSGSSSLKVQLLPALCICGCAGQVNSRDDLMTLMRRHLSFKHHAGTRARSENAHSQSTDL